MLSQARHLVEQRGMFAALGDAAAFGLRQRLRSAESSVAELPGPEISARLPAPPASLIEDFWTYVKGEPGAYAGQVPPALFPQWGLPMALRALRGSGFPLLKLLNGGCRLEVNAPLVRGRELSVRSRFVSVSTDERRSVLCQRVVTEQEGAPEALVANVYEILRLSKGSKAKGRREPELVPDSARKLETWALTRDAGLQFALLTGDVNPLHWLPPYARLMGFRGAILHGFAGMARAWAGLERAFAPRRLRLLDVRFVRPILLPADVSLYVDGERVFVTSSAGEPFITGTFALSSTSQV